MRNVKNIIFFLVLTSTFVIVFNRPSPGISFFELFQNSSFSYEDLNRVINYNPDVDNLFLPPIKEKELFKSVKDLSICRRQEIRKYLYIYLTSGRPYIIRSIENSIKVLPEIKEIFKQNPDIPQELMYLPLLESGFRPTAVSRTQASGIWQFVKITSEVLGLKNDKWIDERFNIKKSTHAAIRHLRNLYKIFNNWELALAAYNGGAGHVSQSMKKSNSDNFWELLEKNAFRRETNEYVPRFLALLIIYKHQEIFGIKNEINKPEIIVTEKISLKYPVKITYLAEISGVSVQTIKKLNPELKKNITPPYQKNYTLIIPAGTKEILNNKKIKLYKVKFSRLKKHKVKKGECISIIARHYKSTTQEIIYINDIKKPYYIKPGNRLYIPI